MKETAKKVTIVTIMAIIMMVAGFGIATAIYSGGIEIRVPRIKIEWTTVHHDLWLSDTISVTD